MANRVTQDAREALQQGGNPNARLTQLAREALQQGANPNARVTQVAVETLVFIGAAVAANVRETQAVLEHTDFPQNDVRETQVPLEWAGTNPPASNVNETQAALEQVGFPPNEVWETQACLEVLFPAVVRRNYAYMGTLART